MKYCCDLFGHWVGLGWIRKHDLDKIWKVTLTKEVRALKACKYEPSGYWEGIIDSDDYSAHHMPITNCPFCGRVLNG